MGWWVLVAVIVVVWLYRWLAYREDRRQGRHAAPSAMSTGRLLGLGLLRTAFKQQGRLSGPVSGVVFRCNPSIPPSHLASYAAGIRLPAGRAASLLPVQPVSLSPCYPQVLSVGIAPHLIVHPGFPLSPMGVIHLRQTIRQLRPLPASGSYALDVFFGRYPNGLLFNESSRGVELNIRVELRDSSLPDQPIVWEGDTFIVSRSSGGGGGGRGRSGAPPVFESPVWDVSSKHSLPEDTGRRYAAISGDFNPIHLYWWTALPMGFRKPIAHGMWTLAAAVSELQALGQIKEGKYPLLIDCEFKKPLFLPGSITFGYKKGANDSVAFGIYDGKNEQPHLIGRIEQ